MRRIYLETSILTAAIDRFQSGGEHQGEDVTNVMMGVDGI
jgi:hypothetical protein